VAKGMDLMALRIRDAAQGAKVPVLQAAPLARALYAHADLDKIMGDSLVIGSEKMVRPQLVDHVSP
jgi:flagellar biosynthetic protein FlhB